MARPRPSSAQFSPRPVILWLAVVYILIFAMVLIGGITRLTGSGLSMVEWQPLIGAIPPLNETEWQAVFDKYKQFPQYQLVNSWMDLEDFKRIFFWEYFHRLFGRLIGLVVFVPWLYFSVRRRMDRRTTFYTFLAFVFGGLQGLLGWYMVKSGLVHVPSVSHFRLAAHLVLAFLVAQWILWIILRLALPSSKPRTATRGVIPRGLPAAVWAFFVLVLVQIVWGAFMAGTKAGWMYPTFPLMNGHWIPPELAGVESFWSGIVNHPSAIHFTHRLLGYAVAAAGLALWLWIGRSSRDPILRAAVAGLFGVVIGQFLLGVATVLLHVPVGLAVAHQGGAFLLLSAATGVGYLTTHRPGR